MGVICDLYDGWEYYISRAEIAFQHHEVNNALTNAQLAQKYANTQARRTAIGIFIAKCHSALGHYQESSQIYRELIQDGTYLPPVMMGLLYNNLEKQQTKKAQKNLTVVKIFSEPEPANGDD